jgi:SAM-dependent methyltransferase
VLLRAASVHERQETKTPATSSILPAAGRDFGIRGYGAILVAIMLVLVIVLAMLLWAAFGGIRTGLKAEKGITPFFGGAASARQELNKVVACSMPMEKRSSSEKAPDKRLLFGSVHWYPETKKRVTKFLRSKMPQTTSEASIRLVCSGASDFEILQGLRELLPHAAVQMGAKPASSAPASTVVRGREKSRLEDIEAEIAMFGARVTPDFGYLDVGSSEGKITGALASALALAKTQAFACDLIEPATKDDRFTFVRNTASKLPFDDAAFDVITMFMSAHHFSDVAAMFGECKRVARPGALVLIREHDCGSPAAGAFYDIVHALYACVLGSEATPKEFLAQYASGTYACYRPRAEWIKLFAAHGFGLSDKIPPHASRFGVDSFDSFYALFEKKGK